MADTVRELMTDGQTDGRTQSHTIYASVTSGGKNLHEPDNSVIYFR